MSIKDHIFTLLNNFKEGNELEIRIGYFKNNGFHSKITEHMFSYFFKYFSDNKLNLSYSYSHIYMYKPGLTEGKIKTIKTFENEISIQKKVKNILDLRKYNLRIALSKEDIIPTQQIYKENCILKRRERFTFTKKGIDFKIDLTRDFYPKYTITQFELEFIKIPKVDELYLVLQWLKTEITKYYAII